MARISVHCPRSFFGALLALLPVFLIEPAAHAAERVASGKWESAMTVDDTSEGVKTIVKDGKTVTMRIKSRRIDNCP